MVQALRSGFFGLSTSLELAIFEKEFSKPVPCDGLPHMEARASADIERGREEIEYTESDLA